MKPRLGSNVYVLWHISKTTAYITLDTVFMKNNDSFITERMLDDCILEDYRKAQKFDDYGKTWFTSKKQIRDFCDANNYVWEFDKKTNEFCICKGADKQC